MPRLRKRALGLLVGAGVLFFLGTNVQAGWLFVLAALLLGVLVTGWILAARAVRHLDVARPAPDSVHQGEEALTDVEVTNRGRRTRRGVTVHDPHLQPAALWVGTVRPSERVEVSTVRVATRRGRHHAEPLTVRSSAPFGVAERRRRVPSEGSTLVLPAVEPLGHLPFIEAVSAVDVAIHSAPRRGQGPEYLGVREYRPGDSMRHVHWRSTARAGEVMVREFEFEQTRRLAIAIDASRDAGESWTPLDRVCSAAASVAVTSLAEGHGARLVTDVEGVPEILSRAGEDEMLERLALVQPGGTDFPALVTGLASSLRGVQTAVLAFPTWATNGPDVLPGAVEALAERIPRVVAIPVVVEPREVATGVLGPVALAGLEQRLRAVGAQVFPWRPSVSLRATLGSERLPR